MLLMMVSLSTSVSAEDIREVVTTSPSWPTFTNMDGTGLYHEIVRNVFAQYGIVVRHEYSKSSRAEEMLLGDVADMMTCDDNAPPSLIMGRYPMYENRYCVFYKKSRIGPWQGVNTLWGMEVLSQPTYYTQSNFPVPVRVKTVQSGVQALAMILLDRSDFYVDDMALIKQSMAENEMPFDKDDYAIETVGSRAYFPLFHASKRGLAIKKLYDEGIKKLHDMGELRAIYEKWGHAYPDFSKY